MSILKKSARFFTLLLLLLTGLSISTPSFAQVFINNPSTQQASENPPQQEEGGEEEEEEDDPPTGIPLDKPCNTVTEIECVPETPMDLTGSATINTDSDGVLISTNAGVITSVSLVSATETISLIPFSSCNSSSNSSLWRTSSGTISVFLTSTLITNAAGQTQASIGGMKLQVCLE